MDASAPDALGARKQPLTIPASLQSGPALLLIYAMWVIVFFEPQWFLPGGGPFQKAVILLSLPTLFVALQYGRITDLYWPLLLFTALHLTAWPGSPDRGLVQAGFIDMAQTAILFTATVAVVRMPDQALWLLKLFSLSFVWYGLQGLPMGGGPGTVGWHPALGNPDGFGGFMVMGIGIGYCTMASSTPRWRYLGYCIFGLALLGVVSAFARGAVIGAALVLVLLWLRSPRKLVALAAGTGVFVILVPAIELFHPGGAFWSEMKTITEGTSSGTGADRKQLWEIGLEVWKERPLLGVGANSTGVVASRIFEFGELEGRYGQPGRLYSRGVHNTYIQLLAEQGLVGFGLWLVMLVGFFLRLHRLRAPGAVAAWNGAVGEGFDLHRLTIGLELAMVGYMVGAFFYNETYHHWFYTLVLLAFLLDRTVRPALPAASEPGGAAP